jgi:cytoskeleton protein RodZ
MNTQIASTFYSDLQESKTETPKETSSVNQKTDNNAVDNNAMKPGSRLRHAREQKNISVEQIANKLFLDVNVIKALEIDDYTSLPSTIFVRGYLRNYAKVLDIPPETVLESYEYTNKKLPTPVFTDPQRNQQTQASSNSWWVKAVTTIVVFALIVLVALWGLNRNSSLPTSEEPKPTVNLELKKPQPIPPPSSTSTSEATQPKTSPVVAGTGYTPSAENSTATEESSASASEGDKNPTGTESASTTETTVPEVKKDPNALKVSLKKGMWMMITDKSNKSLYNTTAKEDVEISVTGTPPFKMKVARADGITVEYMGQKTDFTALPTFSRKGRQATIGTTSNP